MDEQIELEARYCASNYHPLPVVLTRGEGLVRLVRERIDWAITQLREAFEEFDRLQLAA